MTEKLQKHKNIKHTLLGEPVLTGDQERQDGVKAPSPNLVFVFFAFRDTKKLGFSLVELILAIALFGLFATALIGLLMNSYGSDFQAEEKEKANLYAQEGLEAVWSIRRQAWNLLENGDHGLDKGSGHWQFSSSPDLLEEKYTRTITIADACRNLGGDITDCSVPGALVDLHTKKATVIVTYPAITGITNRLALLAYLTTWQSKDFIQTDWSGGGGQTVWSGANRYSSDDGNLDVTGAGQVTLAGSSGGGCGNKVWSFANADDYTLSNPAKIEVINGFAQLKSQAGPPATSQTVNPSFNTTLNPWTTGSWGTISPTFSRPTGGNPSRYARISFPSARNRISGGFYQQQFTVTQSDIISASLNLDWRVFTASRVPDSLILYAFVDTVSGAPTIGQEVWNSGSLSGTTNWSTVSNINVSTKVFGPGTYYLKIVAYVDYPNNRSASYQVGFDNVLLSWTYPTNPTYPADKPNVNPSLPYSVSGLDAWSAFTEVANKNGGEIYYQISDGATWYWWNAGWIPANIGLGTTDYNPASEVNANISSFPTVSGQILFKAFLASSGTQLVQLDEIKISCAQYYDWSFDMPADYTYNPAEIEMTGGSARLVGSSSCTGLPNACNTYSEQVSCEGQSGCAWTLGSGSCQNNGQCSSLSRTQCNTCSAGGCYRSGNRCRGTLNCSVYNQTACSSCSQCRWVTSSGSCSGTPNACNTYSDQVSCEGQSGCAWSGLYPISSNIQSANSYNTPSVWEYTAFVENATKNGGEVYYQLSDGTTWYWWNGLDWSPAGTTNYNPASVVNANISLLPTTTQQIGFKAFLIGDGTQAVQLNNVRIGWGESVANSGYAPFGYLISSAFNMGPLASPSIIKWTEVIPACSPACSVKFQLRTAPDAGGSPGSWSNWYGSAGSGTYFTNPAGSLISPDLNSNQWLQYRAELTGDGIKTPILEEVKINYLP